MTQANQRRLFERPEGPCCRDCRLESWCGSMRTEHACPPTFRAHARAGIEGLHPMRADFDIYFDRVGGVAFDDIVAQPQATMSWKPYLPQISWNGSLRRQ